MVTLAVSLPFTRAQFLDVFAAYNTALWPFAAALWLLTAGAVVVLLTGRRGAGRLLNMLLASQWAWAALAYHAAFFSKINPAAWLFSAMFLVQAGLLVWFGVLRADLRYSIGPNRRHYLASIFVVYALLYPAIAWADAAAYPRLPTFGVPCPLTILTIGFLLASDRPIPGALAPIPFVWALIGGSAAFLLGMHADVLLAAGFCLILPVVGARCRRWGVSETELHQPLPGDEQICAPNYVAMMAVTIDAPPECIWPWLLQLGKGRGGLYSYDGLDRLFGYLDRPSADRILPEFQHLAVGDVIPVGGAAGGFPVKAVKPGEALVLGGSTDAFEWVWTFVLVPVAGRGTRFISRSQARVPPSISSFLLMLALEPAAFVMTRKMLLGIKRRAEAQGRESRSSPSLLLPSGRV